MKQEFVTLPREVVEQAIDALYCTNSKEGSPAYNFELKAIKELRAALERPQVVRETAPDGATHIQPQQGAFYKRVDEKWYVWSRMEDGRPHRWYISPGTVESCLKPISAATERLQNHVPDAGNMVPAGWKLVPLEPTHEMLRAGRDAHYEAEKRIQDQDAWSPGGFAKRAVRAAHVFQAMLAAAPQPPVVEQPPTADDSSEVEQPQVEQEICCKIWSVNRIDDLGKIVDSSGRLIATVYGSQADKIVACHNSYTQQQPKREPLTDEQIIRMVNQAGWDAVNLEDGFGERIRRYTEILEAAHDIK